MDTHIHIGQESMRQNSYSQEIWVPMLIANQEIQIYNMRATKSRDVVAHVSMGKEVVRWRSFNQKMWVPILIVNREI